MALFFSSALGHAITIDHSAPVVIKEDGASPLRQAYQSVDEITFDIPFSDRDHHTDAWTISLTSGHLAIDKNVIISGPDAAHLALKRYEPAPGLGIFSVPSARSVSFEEPTTDHGGGQPTRLVLLMGGITVMLFASIVLLCRHHWQSRQRRIRFGLLWDGNKHPICTKCNQPLRVLNDFSFQCPTCQVELGARAESGTTISPHEALAKIQLKEYWLGS